MKNVLIIPVLVLLSLNIAFGQNKTKDNTETTTQKEFIRNLAKQAYELARQQEHHKVIVLLDSILMLDPRYAWAYSQKGEALRNLADAPGAIHREITYKQAIANFNTSLEINPKSSWAYAHKGEALRSLGDMPGDIDREKLYRQAIECFSKAIELNPENGWAYAHRGALYCTGRMGSSYYQKALEDLNKALALTDYNYPWAYGFKTVAYVLLGYDYQQQGNFEHAAKNFQHAMWNMLVTNYQDYRILTNNTFEPAHEFGRALSKEALFSKSMILYSKAAKEKEENNLSKAYFLYTQAVADHYAIAERKGKAAHLAETLRFLDSIEKDATPKDAAHILLMRAGLAQLQNNRKQAIKYLNAAIENEETAPMLKGMILADVAWYNLRNDPYLKKIVLGSAND